MTHSLTSPEAEHLAALFTECIDMDYRTRRRTLHEARIDLKEMIDADVDLPTPEIYARQYRQELNEDRLPLTAHRPLTEVWPTPFLWLSVGIAGSFAALMALLAFAAYEQVYVYDAAGNWADAWRQTLADRLWIPRLRGSRILGCLYLLAGWSLAQLLAGWLATRRQGRVRRIGVLALVPTAAITLLVLLGRLSI